MTMIWSLFVQKKNHFDFLVFIAWPFWSQILIIMTMTTLLGYLHKNSIMSIVHILNIFFIMTVYLIAKCTYSILTGHTFNINQQFNMCGLKHMIFIYRIPVVLQRTEVNDQKAWIFVILTLDACGNAPLEIVRDLIAYSNVFQVVPSLNHICWHFSRHFEVLYCFSLSVFSLISRFWMEFSWSKIVLTTMILNEVKLFSHHHKAHSCDSTGIVRWNIRESGEISQRQRHRNNHRALSSVTMTESISQWNRTRLHDVWGYLSSNSSEASKQMIQANKRGAMVK